MTNDTAETTRSMARRALNEWATRLNDQACEWDLETVKHLVVLNAAGVAGAAALLSRPDDHAMFSIALVLFGFGVIFAVLNMHLASTSFQRMSEEVRHRIESLDAPDIAVDELFRDPAKGRWLNSAGQCAGWISAGTAIFATGLITWALLG